MSATPVLPISDFVQVVVSAAPSLPQQPTFNIGLIIGPSTIIPQSQRIRTYTSLNQLLTDGFITSSPEYLAAQLYFDQSPAPQSLQVGRQDLSAIQTIQVHVANEGTGYQIGDILGVVQGPASGGTVRVVTIGGGGQVTSVVLVTEGTGYSAANGLVTTGGHGSGAQVDILTVGETPLQAVQACRIVSAAWYCCMVTSAGDSDHLAIAAYIEAANPPSTYLFTTGDAAVLNNTVGNVCSLLSASDYSRTMPFYSTTQSGLAPNNIYAAAASMGRMMGLNTGLPGSFFTAKFKTLVGVIAEPLSETQRGNVESLNCNVYLTFGNSFTFQEQGVMSSGAYFDQILNRDMLASDIQFTVADRLVSLPSVPQTDPGQTQLLHDVSEAAERARVRGYIASGVWQGVQIIKLVPGNTLPSGYLAQSYPYSTQSQADKAARKAMPVLLAIIEAGAVHSLLVGVYIQ